MSYFLSPKYFFLLLSLSYVIVSVAFDLVALIGSLKYWVLQTDWVWLCQEIWSSVAWLYSKASDCPSFLQSLGKLNDIGEMPQDIIMQSQEEFQRLCKPEVISFFYLHFLRNEMPLYLSWNKNHTSTPNFKIFPWPTGPKVLLIIMVLEKISWNTKECSFWFSVFLFKVTPYNLHSGKATGQENSQVRSHMQLAAVDFLFFKKSCMRTYLEECVIIQKRTETWNYQENTLIYKGRKIKYIYLLLKTIE